MHHSALFKPLLIIIFSFWLLIGMVSDISAQKTKADKVYLDSLISLLTPEELDSLNLDAGILAAPKPKNILDFSVQLSNGTLSKTDYRGNNFNSTKLLVTPLLSYTLKNGLGISYENVLTTSSRAVTVLQHTVSLYYDYAREKKFEFGLFANKIFRKDSLPYDATLFDYSIGGSVSYVKTYLQPILLVSYSFGNFNEKIVRPLFTANYKVNLKELSVTAGIRHNYYFEKIFTKKDELYFIPKILLNNGSQYYKTFNPTRNRFTQRLMNNGFIPRSINATFQPLSLGVDLEASYGFGKFYVSPNLYFDYYLHSAEKRLYAISGITFGVNF